MNFQFECTGGFMISITFMEGELKSEKSEAGSQSITVSAPAVIQASSDDDDEELVAVITAAISASLGTGAKVLGIAETRARPVSAWRINGWVENFEGFTD